MWYWKETNAELSRLLEIVYFKNKWFRWINRNELIMRIYNYFKIINAMREKAIDEMDNIKENSINESGNLDSGARDSNYAYHMADVGTDSHER